MNKRSMNNSHGAPIWLNFGFSIYNVTVYWYLWFQFNTCSFIVNWVMSWLVIKLCSFSYLKTTIQFQWRQNLWMTLLLPPGRFVWKLFIFLQIMAAWLFYLCFLINFLGVAADEICTKTTPSSSAKAWSQNVCIIWLNCNECMCQFLACFILVYVILICYVQWSGGGCRC